MRAFWSGVNGVGKMRGKAEGWHSYEISLSDVEFSGAPHAQMAWPHPGLEPQ